MGCTDQTAESYKCEYNTLPIYWLFLHSHALLCVLILLVSSESLLQQNSTDKNVSFGHKLLIKLVFLAR